MQPYINPVIQHVLSRQNAKTIMLNLSEAFPYGEQASKGLFIQRQQIYAKHKHALHTWNSNVAPSTWARLHSYESGE